MPGALWLVTFVPHDAKSANMPKATFEVDCSTDDEEESLKRFNADVDGFKAEVALHRGAPSVILTLEERRAGAEVRTDPAKLVHMLMRYNPAATPPNPLPFQDSKEG
jgi:hypothetical protein